MAMTDDEQRQLDIIGYNLSRLLKQNGATQRELASAIGCKH
jgi:transcriptional regulator with XRE-family HTH domain